MSTHPTTLPFLHPLGHRMLATEPVIEVFFGVTVLGYFIVINNTTEEEHRVHWIGVRTESSPPIWGVQIEEELPFNDVARKLITEAHKYLLSLEFQAAA